MGKSSLLREFAHIASQLGVRVVQLDGRTIDATPDGFLTALRYGLNAPAEAVFSALAAENGRLQLQTSDKELHRRLERVEKKLAQLNWSILAAASVISATLLFNRKQEKKP